MSNTKDRLLYLLCVPIISWSIYEGLNVYAHTQTLEKDHSECYQKNPRRMEVFFGTMAFMALTMNPVQSASKAIFTKILPTEKFPLETKSRELKIEVMAEKLYRMISYGVFTLMGFFIMKDSNILHTYLLGTEQNPQYFANYPCVQTLPYLDEYALIKMGYYFYETFVFLPINYKRHDFAEVLFHHLLTLTLATFAYCTNMMTLCPVMILMDFSDIFVALFKLTVDVYERVQVFTYILMITTWAYTRLFFFPIYILYAGWVQAQGTGNQIVKEVSVILWTFFVGIFLLSAFWFWLMIKGLIRRFTTKQDKKTVHMNVE